MATYLLTWNPKRWEWDMAENLAALAKRGFVDSRWSCGITKRIDVNDRVFLLRQGREPRGIMASGVSRSKPYLDDHWDDNRSDKALYIRARFDVLLDPENDGVLESATVSSDSSRWGCYTDKLFP